MGISGLLQRLHPYATRYSPEDLAGGHAVIDGPSLAYHAHRLALAAGSSQSRLPTYADINTQAIRWLNALEDINIVVSAVVFDGALPDEKKNERLSRLDQNNRQVGRFRAQYPTAACPIPLSLGSVSYPLLAPALREALFDTKYASLTHVVPGEADDWCAFHARDTPRSIIFTSDTDLVLYEYPPECRVVFFKDVDLWPEPKIKGYSPLKLARKLELASLVRLAYVLTIDPSKTFVALLEDTKRIDTASSEYGDFSRRYTGRRVASLMQDLRLQHLDVRVSEFVHQCLDGTLVPINYLPLLVEDPNQASAWNIEQNIRRLAYSLLTPGQSVVREYKRKAQAVAKHEIRLYSAEETCAAAASLARHVSSLLQWTVERQVPRELVWPLIATDSVLRDLPPPRSSTMIRVLQGDFDNTWNFVHLTARIQAALYSFRFLKQSIAVWVAVHPDGAYGLRHDISQLYRDLESMPSIAELFSVPGQAKKMTGDQDMVPALVSEMYAFTNVEVPPEHVPNKKMKKKKREAERKNRRRQEAGQQQNNMFDLLQLGS